MHHVESLAITTPGVNAQTIHATKNKLAHPNVPPQTTTPTPHPPNDPTDYSPPRNHGLMSKRKKRRKRQGRRLKPRPTAKAIEQVQNGEVAAATDEEEEGGEGEEVMEDEEVEEDLEEEEAETAEAEETETQGKGRRMEKKRQEVHSANKLRITS